MYNYLPKSSGKLHILSPITEPPGPILGLPGLLILQAASQNSLVSNLFVFPWQPPLSETKKTCTYSFHLNQTYYLIRLGLSYLLSLIWLTPVKAEAFLLFFIEPEPFVPIITRTWSFRKFTRILTWLAIFLTWLTR